MFRCSYVLPGSSASARSRDPHQVSPIITFRACFGCRHAEGMKDWLFGFEVTYQHVVCTSNHTLIIGVDGVMIPAEPYLLLLTRYWLACGWTTAG